MLRSLRRAAPLALVAYLAALFAVTQLPLPHGPVACSGMQLDPLQIVRTLREESSGSLPALLGSVVVRQFAENVALFVPAGVIVALLARRRAAVVVASGFALALLVEITQATGLWGAAPCAYRVFDVTDLIANTSGAALGGLLLSLVAAVVGAAGPARRAAGRPV